jgi:class III poly(R)-hydroxyalkanoic acid synthase PhaE subunit
VTLYEFWFGTIARAFDTQASNPLAAGIERTFGALADAFGLGPGRELSSAWVEAMTAAAVKQGAQAEYLLIIAEAWRKGTEQVVAQLVEMGARGEGIESLLTIARLWAKAVDGAMHDAMQSERGLQATAGVVRAATRHRRQVQKVVGVISESLHMPTRAELDEAYREIQELKRELRRLKKSRLPASQPSRTEDTSA